MLLFRWFKHGALLSLIALLASCGGGGGGGDAPQVQPISMASIKDEFDPTPPGEPLEAQQWHLWSAGANVPTYGNTFENTGRGISVALLDTAIQISHPELVGRVSYAADFIDVDADPSPISDVWHGTAVAGTIAAAARGASYLGAGEGGRGVAPLAQLIAFRVVPEDGSTTGGYLYEALATAVNKGARVVNNSWTHKDLAKLTDVDLDWRETLSAVVAQTTSPVVVFAAGNESYSVDATAVPMQGAMSNWDTYTNSRHVIAVGATNSLGNVVSYSEPGANVLISAPGGSTGEGLVTTDLTGTAGLNASGDYMGGDTGSSGFVGTSGAAAVTSGVVALMLQANPQLGAREVAWILADTAAPIGCAGDLCSNWMAPSAAAMAAQQYSHRYGFGRVDASAAVAQAQSFSPFGAEKMCSSGKLVPDLTLYSGVQIPEVTHDGTVTFLTRSVSMGAGCPGVVERVELIVHIVPTTEYSRSRYSGDLHIKLTSPSNRVSEITRPHACGSSCGDISSGFTFSSVRHMGESPVGAWTLDISDEVANDRSRLDDWEIRIYGH